MSSRPYPKHAPRPARPPAPPPRPPRTAPRSYRVDWSDKLLGFECGGQQWVSEVCFPSGTRTRPSGADIAYMRELLDLVEASDVPAPSPIEQRWSASSRARMSPAHSAAADGLFSWVGIIMYMPTDDAEQRAAITERFRQYNHMCRASLWPKYGAHQHWAKIEPPDDEAELARVCRRLDERYPLAELNEAKRRLDPKHVLANPMTDVLLARGADAADGQK